LQAKYDSYDDMIMPKSATLCYTSALLKCRGVADKFEPETMHRRGFSAGTALIDYPISCMFSTNLSLFS